MPKTDHSNDSIPSAHLCQASHMPGLSAAVPWGVADTSRLIVDGRFLVQCGHFRPCSKRRPPGSACMFPRRSGCLLWHSRFRFGQHLGCDRLGCSSAQHQGQHGQRHGLMKRPWLGRRAPSETGALELYAELLDGRAITPVQSLRHLFDKLLQSVVTESLRIPPVKSVGTSGSESPATTGMPHW